MRAMLNIFYKKPNLIIFTKIIFIFLFLLNLYNISFSFKIFLLLNLVLLVHYISFVYFLKNENNKYFPILPLIIIFFFITYTLSFLIGSKDLFFLSFDAIVLQKSIFILVLGLSFLLFGYIIVDKFFTIRKKKIFYFNFSEQQQLLILVVCSIMTFLVYYNNTCFSFVNFSFLKQIKEPLILFNFGLFLMLILIRNNKSFFLYIIFIVLLFILFIFEISSGATVFVFCLLSFLIAIYFYLKKKLPLISIVIIILLAIFFHSMKHQLRQLAWEKNATINCIDKIFILKSVASNFDYADKSKTDHTSYYDLNTIRLFHSINSLNIISKLTPDIVPFFQGNSYKMIYSKFIPRDFWDNKPEDIQGNFWGHRYFILNPHDKETSWNFPVLNEFYANFGIVGVIFGMFFLGFFTKLLLLKLWTKNSSNIEMLTSSVIIFNLFFLENNLSQILGKIINQFIFFNIFIFFLYLLIKLISKYFKSFSL
jgi:hypothetical protein